MCCGYPKVSRVYSSIYAMDVVLPCGGRSSVNTSKNAIDLLVRSALYNFRGEKISLVWGGRFFSPPGKHDRWTLEVNRGGAPP